MKDHSRVAKDYRIRLQLCESEIRTSADLKSIVYILYAPSPEMALSYAYLMAEQEFPNLLILSAEIDPMFN